MPFSSLQNFSLGVELEWKHTAEVSWRKLTLQVERKGDCQGWLLNLQPVTWHSDFVNNEEALEEEILTLTLPSSGSCSCNPDYGDFETEILFFLMSNCLKK